MSIKSNSFEEAHTHSDTQTQPRTSEWTKQHTQAGATIYGIHNIKEIAPKNQIGINYAENKLESKNEIQMRQTPQE